MIRILELEASKGWGGQERRTVRLANALDKRHFEIHFGVDEESELFRRKNLIDAHLFPLSIRKSYDISALMQVVRYIKTHHIDIISTHSGKDGWIGALAGKITGAKVVRTRHLQTSISSPISYNMSSKVVAVSHLVREALIESGVKANKVVTIHTGIDTNRFHPGLQADIRSLLNLDPKTLVVGIVAVLRNAKRHKDLIEAFSHLQSDHPLALAIIGSGPQEENIRRFIQEKRVQNVHLLGYRDDVDRLLASIDIFVLPSEMEALGTAVLEASACGVPAIASNVGGIPETMIESETGLLFKPKEIVDLQKKLQYLIDNENIRKKMGQKARAFIEQNYSVEAMAHKSAALYEELV